jgi:hypothetical protein
MTGERKFALLFAATLLCARKLMNLESDRPTPARIRTVDRAIREAAYILEQIDAKWPKSS